MSDQQDSAPRTSHSRPWCYLFGGRAGLERLDADVAHWMHRWGHFLHRIPLGVFFLWLGLLKVLGQPSATSLIAQAVYIGDPALTVPLLGIWEMMIGLGLLYKPMLRLGLLLLFIRLPGTMIALIVHWEICFDVAPFVPTVVGQYLIKDLILFGAAMVIGGTVRLADKPDDEVEIKV